MTRAAAILAALLAGCALVHAPAPDAGSDAATAKPAPCPDYVRDYRTDAGPPPDGRCPFTAGPIILP